MNVAHERAHTLREELRSERLLSREAADALAQPWRSNAIVARATFFVLAALGFGLFYGFVAMLRLPRPGFVAGVVGIGVAEYLIRKLRWFGTGVEEALWICAAISLISELPSSGAPEAMLVLAAGCAIPGWRVRNPLFGAVAAMFVVQYAERRADLGTLAALLIALAAMLALLGTWRRPSNEWLMIAIVLVLPIAGRFNADVSWRPVTIALYTAFAVVALILGITRRHHAFFLAAMIAGSIAGSDVSRLIATPIEVKLAISGALLLAMTFLIMRALRGNTRGFVLTPAKLTPFDDAMQLAATAVMQPDVKSSSSDGFEGGEGSFGGAGATGGF
ncbi:MAG: hypothetical protein M3Q69_09810 [Acidobacteriota bacterium]|nr:hypothetical protein [Acidobacteriota bacterium]